MNITSIVLQQETPRTLSHSTLTIFTLAAEWCCCSGEFSNSHCAESNDHEIGL